MKVGTFQERQKIKPTHLRHLASPDILRFTDRPAFPRHNPIVPHSGCPRRGDKQGAEGNPPSNRPLQGAQPHWIHRGVSQEQGVKQSKRRPGRATPIKQPGPVPWAELKQGTGPWLRQAGQGSEGLFLHIRYSSYCTNYCFTLYLNYKCIWAQTNIIPPICNWVL